jgi:hypothetical protein
MQSSEEGGVFSVCVLGFCVFKSSAKEGWRWEMGVLTSTEYNWPTRRAFRAQGHPDREPENERRDWMEHIHRWALLCVLSILEGFHIVQALQFYHFSFGIFLLLFL